MTAVGLDPWLREGATPGTNKHIVSAVPDAMIMPDTAWHS